MHAKNHSCNPFSKSAPDLPKAITQAANKRPTDWPAILHLKNIGTNCLSLRFGKRLQPFTNRLIAAFRPEEHGIECSLNISHECTIFCTSCPFVSLPIPTGRGFWRTSGQVQVSSSFCLPLAMGDIHEWPAASATGSVKKDLPGGWQMRYIGAFIIDRFSPALVTITAMKYRWPLRCCHSGPEHR